MRRPLLSIPKNEPGSRSGARLSTTRRSIQPKNKPLAHGDQKRSVTFTETQGPQASPGAPKPTADPTVEARKSSPASATLEVPSSSTVTADLHTPGPAQVPTISSKEKREQWGLRSSLPPPPSISRPTTPTPPPRTCSPLPPPRTCSPLPLNRTCSPFPLSRTSSPLPFSRTSSPLSPPLPVLSAAPAPGPPSPPPLPASAPPPLPALRPARGVRESPGDEDTAALLPRSDTLLHLSEEGTENPLLAPLLSFASPRRSPRRLPLPLSPVDLDLDQSHV